MRVGELDLSSLSGEIDPSAYKRLQKTHIRLLSSQVPESFVEKFEDEETALAELLDAVYGCWHEDEDEPK